MMLLAASLGAFALTSCSNYSRRPYTEIPLAEGEEEVAPNEFCAFEDFFNGALHEHAAVFHDDNAVAPVCDILHTV